VNALLIAERHHPRGRVHRVSCDCHFLQLQFYIVQFYILHFYNYNFTFLHFYNYNFTFFAITILQLQAYSSVVQLNVENQITDCQITEQRIVDTTCCRTVKLSTSKVAEPTYCRLSQFRLSSVI
jgi:hypothetical protein